MESPTSRLPQDFEIPEDPSPEWLEAVLAHINTPDDSQLTTRMGIRYTAVSRDFVEATMPVAGNLQPAGLLNGGSHLVLTESLGSMHAWMLSGGSPVVGLDINATHLGAIREGEVHARAEVLHRGATMIHHEVKMRDAGGRLLSTARITNLVRRRPGADSA